MKVFIEGVDGSGLTTTGTATANDGTDLTDSSKVLSDFSVDDFVNFIQNAATGRATNGAEMSRLEQSLALLTTNHANIEGARSRLMDVDIATESTHFAKHNILVQDKLCGHVGPGERSPECCTATARPSRPGTRTWPKP